MAGSWVEVGDTLDEGVLHADNNSMQTPMPIEIVRFMVASI